MNGHVVGCQCAACLAEKGRANRTTPYPGTTWIPFPAPPIEPYPSIVMYMAGVPDQPFPQPPPTVTIATWPESTELVEIRKLREEVAKLAKTQTGMMELVKRALVKGRAKS